MNLEEVKAYLEENINNGGAEILNELDDNDNKMFLMNTRPSVQKE